MLNFHIAHAPCLPWAPSITPVKKLDSYYHRFLLGRLQYPKANRKQWSCIGVLWAVWKWFFLGMNSQVGFSLEENEPEEQSQFSYRGLFGWHVWETYRCYKAQRQQDTKKLTGSGVSSMWVGESVQWFTRNNSDTQVWNLQVKTLPVILNILLWIREFVCEART